MPFNISPSFTGPVSFTSITEDVINPAGILVSTLFTSAFSDANGNSFAGIAISSDTSVSGADGNWQYSLDGTTWVDINTPTVPLIDHALLLSNSTYLRFVPALNFIGIPGTLTVFAIDNSSATTFTSAAKRYFDTTGDDHKAIDANQSRVSASGVLLTTNVLPVNDVPSFTKGGDQTVLEDSGAHTVTGWATGLSAGPSNESAQILSFIVTNSNNNLFSVQPAIDANGTLTYTSAANSNGSATVTVQIHDNGGITNGGVDTSATKSFLINVTAQNDAPTVSAPESSSASLGSSAYEINLLLLASDVDGDALTVSGVTYSVDGVPTGNGGLDLPSGVTLTGSTLTVDPANSAYAAIDYGGTVAIVAHYTIRDGSGGAVTQSETITLTRTTDFPIVTQAESTTASEGDIATGVNLLLHASDPEDNDLSVGDVIYTVNGVATGNGGTDLPSGVTRTGSMLTLDPDNAAFNYLGAGEQAVILVTYRVIDHTGGSVEQTETITINGTNDIPVVSAPESSTSTEGDASYSLNLLLHASDPDSSDTLSVSGVTYTVDGIPTGNGGDDLPAGITWSGSTLTVDPANVSFNHLAVGETTEIVASYIISDSSGRTVHQSETVTINGQNDAPTVSASESSSASLGSSAYNINLLLLASDVDGDALTVSDVTYTVDGVPTGNGGLDLPSGVTLTGSTLTVDPANSAYAAVGDGAQVTIVASYIISDGNGGMATQTETLTLIRTTDIPLVSQPESITVSEGDILTDVNLLQHASDPDDDDLTIGDIIYTVNGLATGSGGKNRPSGILQVYNSLTLDPTDSAFDYLAVGEQTTILVHYSVIDHAGGLVSQTGTITINGTNDIPTVSAAESSITTEGDASYSLNLLLHASDPDSSDTLTVGSVTYTVDGIPTGNGGSDLPAGVTQNGSTLTIDPDNGWFSHLAVGERSTIVASYIISDSSGSSVHQDATVTINGSDDFDGEPPTVISFSPADGETGVSINENIVLSFSEPVVRGIGLIAIHADSSTGTVIESYNAETSTNLTVSGSTLTINPSASLVYGKHYYVTFADGSIDDYAGNHFAGSNSYGFTTGADPYAGSSDDNECTELFISGVGALGILAWLVF